MLRCTSGHILLVMLNYGVVTFDVFEGSVTSFPLFLDDVHP